MADTIQSSSSLPLPNYQTSQGTRDPLPLAGPEQSTRDDAAAAAKSNQAQDSDFEDYLNQAAITEVKKQSASRRFDAATEIANSSVYKPPGSTTPI